MADEAFPTTKLVWLPVSYLYDSRPCQTHPIFDKLVAQVQPIAHRIPQVDRNVWQEPLALCRKQTDARVLTMAWHRNSEIDIELQVLFHRVIDGKRVIGRSIKIFAQVILTCKLA